MLQNASLWNPEIQNVFENILFTHLRTVQLVHPLQTGVWAITFSLVATVFSLLKGVKAAADLDYTRQVAWSQFMF